MDICKQFRAKNLLRSSVENFDNSNKYLERKVDFIDKKINFNNDIIIEKLILVTEKKNFKEFKFYY